MERRVSTDSLISMIDVNCMGVTGVCVCGGWGTSIGKNIWENLPKDKENKEKIETKIGKIGKKNWEAYPAADG